MLKYQTQPTTSRRLTKLFTKRNWGDGDTVANRHRVWTLIKTPTGQFSRVTSQQLCFVDSWRSIASVWRMTMPTICYVVSPLNNCDLFLHCYCHYCSSRWIKTLCHQQTLARTSRWCHNRRPSENRDFVDILSRPEVEHVAISRLVTALLRKPLFHSN